MIHFTYGTRQDGASEDHDFARGVSAAADGSFFIADFTYGSWGATNVGRSDFCALKIDSEGEELWVWQVGKLAVNLQYGSIPHAPNCGSSWRSWLSFGRFVGCNLQVRGG